MILAMSMWGAATAAEVPFLEAPVLITEDVLKIRRRSHRTFYVGVGLSAVGPVLVPIGAGTNALGLSVVGGYSMAVGLPTMALASLRNRRALEMAGVDVSRKWGDAGLILWGVGSLAIATAVPVAFLGPVYLALGSQAVTGEDPEVSYERTAMALLVTFLAGGGVLYVGSAVASSLQMVHNGRAWKAIDGELSSERPTVKVGLAPQITARGGALALTGTW